MRISRFTRNRPAWHPSMGIAPPTRLKPTHATATLAESKQSLQKIATWDLAGHDPMPVGHTEALFDPTHVRVVATKWVHLTPDDRTETYVQVEVSGPVWNPDLTALTARTGRNVYRLHEPEHGMPGWLGTLVASHLAQTAGVTSDD